MKCSVEIVFGYAAHLGEKSRIEVYVETDIEDFDWSLADSVKLRRLQLDHAADNVFFAAMIDTPAGRQVAGICMGEVAPNITPEAAEKYVRKFYQEILDENPVV